MLHRDLFGPSRTMILGGNYYGLVIVDDFSRFTWTLFIASKDHAFTAFKHLARVLENENSCHISSIKSDHGVSLKMKDLKIFAQTWHQTQFFSSKNTSAEWCRGEEKSFFGRTSPNSVK